MAMAAKAGLRARHLAPLGRNRGLDHRRSRGRDRRPGRSRPGRRRAATASAKYNQLLRIEEELGAAAKYAGRAAIKQLTGRQPWHGDAVQGRYSAILALPSASYYMTHTLVLLRHGESTWNKENRFTGWTDVDLTDKGREEAREAGRLLKDDGSRPSTSPSRRC